MGLGAVLGALVDAGLRFNVALRASHPGAGPRRAGGATLPRVLLLVEDRARADARIGLLLADAADSSMVLDAEELRIARLWCSRMIRERAWWDANAKYTLTSMLLCFSLGFG